MEQVCIQMQQLVIWVISNLSLVLEEQDICF